MSKIVYACVVLASMALAGVHVARVWAAQNPSRSNDPTQTPPPAYTPRPPAAPAAEDTPAQRETLERMKARANEQSEAARKSYNLTITSNYNFHYGKDKPFAPGNIKVQGEGFLQPGAFPSAEYCGACHQEA
jgi:hypothetical protein